MKSKKILLLGNRDDHYWLRILEEAISTLNGVLEIADEASVHTVSWHDHDLVILDASVFGDLASTVRCIRSRNPEARVVVFSPAPTWKQAREVMLAGAKDYARKSLDRANILSTLEKNLAAQAPFWQSQD